MSSTATLHEGYTRPPAGPCISDEEALAAVPRYAVPLYSARLYRRVQQEEANLLLPLGRVIEARDFQPSSVFRRSLLTVKGCGAVVQAVRLSPANAEDGVDTVWCRVTALLFTRLVLVTDMRPVTMLPRRGVPLLRSPCPWQAEDFATHADLQTGARLLSWLAGRGAAGAGALALTRAPIAAAVAAVQAGMTTRLHPYQRAAVGWMLHRELVPLAWERRGTGVSMPHYPALGSVVRHTRVDGAATALPVYGGVLADEMGMGKTVEAVAMIAGGPAPAVPLGTLLPPCGGVAGVPPHRGGHGVQLASLGLPLAALGTPVDRVRTAAGTWNGKAPRAPRAGPRKRGRSRGPLLDMLQALSADLEGEGPPPKSARTHGAGAGGQRGPQSGRPGPETGAPPLGRGVRRGLLLLPRTGPADMPLRLVPAPEEDITALPHPAAPGQHESAGAADTGATLAMARAMASGAAASPPSLGGARLPGEAALPGREPRLGYAPSAVAAGLAAAVTEPVAAGVPRGIPHGAGALAAAEEAAAAMGLPRRMGRLQGGTLVIVPPNLLAQWAAAILQHGGQHLRVFVHHGSRAVASRGTCAADLAQYDVVLTTPGVAENSARRYSLDERGVPVRLERGVVNTGRPRPVGAAATLEAALQAGALAGGGLSDGDDTPPSSGSDTEVVLDTATERDSDSDSDSDETVEADAARTPPPGRRRSRRGRAASTWLGRWVEGDDEGAAGGRGAARQTRAARRRAALGVATPTALTAGRAAVIAAATREAQAVAGGAPPPGGWRSAPLPLSDVALCGVHWHRVIIDERHAGMPGGQPGLRDMLRRVHKRALWVLTARPFGGGGRTHTHDAFATMAALYMPHGEGGVVSACNSLSLQFLRAGILRFTAQAVAEMDLAADVEAPLPPLHAQVQWVPWRSDCPVARVHAALLAALALGRGSWRAMGHLVRASLLLCVRGRAGGQSVAAAPGGDGEASQPLGEVWGTLRQVLLGGRGAGDAAAGATATAPVPVEVPRVPRALTAADAFNNDTPCPVCYGDMDSSAAWDSVAATAPAAAVPWVVMPCRHAYCAVCLRSLLQGAAYTRCCLCSQEMPVAARQALMETASAALGLPSLPVVAGAALPAGTEELGHDGGGEAVWEGVAPLEGLPTQLLAAAERGVTSSAPLTDGIETYLAGQTAAGAAAGDAPVMTAKLAAAVATTGGIVAGNPAARVLLFVDTAGSATVVADALVHAGVPALQLDALPQRGRGAVLAAWDAVLSPTPPRERVLVASFASAGAGCNLTAADHVVLLGPPRNAALVHQAVGRAWRQGQRRPVHVHLLAMRHSVEELILRTNGMLPRPTWTTAPDAVDAAAEAAVGGAAPPPATAAPHVHTSPLSIHAVPCSPDLLQSAAASTRHLHAVLRRAAQEALQR